MDNNHYFKKLKEQICRSIETGNLEMAAMALAAVAVAALAAAVMALAGAVIALVAL